MINNTQLNLSEKRIQLIIWTLLCMMPLIGMTVDIIAPSLPAIANQLQVSSQITKNLMAIYFLGYALGNFCMGFLTDAFGRQKFIRLSVTGFVLVNLLPLFFPRIEVLLLTRFLQGLTLGAISVCVRAIISDILPAEKLVRVGPLIGGMWGIGPVIGPVIGGYLQFCFGWQAEFYFLVLLGTMGVIFIYLIIPETHCKRHPLNFKTIARNLAEVSTHRLFIAITLLMGLTYSLMIAFSTLGSFLIQEILHYSPVFFGHLALWMGMIFFPAPFICRYLLKFYQVEKLFLVILNVFFVVAVSGVIASYFFNESLILTAVISGLMFFVCGFIFPLSMGKGLSLFRHIAGTASAMMYLVNMLITGLTGFVISFISIQNIVPLMWVYALILLACVIIYWCLIREGSSS